MIFVGYFVAAFVAYVLLYPVYTFEMTNRWRMSFTAGVLLCACKALDWGLYMQVDALAGSLAAALICPLAIFGLQEAVDAYIRQLAANDKRPVFLLRLSNWRRAPLSIGNIADGWIHLALFHYLLSFDQTIGIGPSSLAFFAGACNVAAHTVALLSTYPFTAVRRGKARLWEGFALFYVRSSIASFAISFLVFIQ